MCVRLCVRVCVCVCVCVCVRSTVIISAAGLVLGYGVIGLGTDTSGSIMLPSSAQSLYGLRPTFNATLPMDGILPLDNTMDSVGRNQWNTR